MFHDGGPESVSIGGGVGARLMPVTFFLFFLFLLIIGNFTVYFFYFRIKIFASIFFYTIIESSTILLSRIPRDLDTESESQDQWAKTFFFLPFERNSTSIRLIDARISKRCSQLREGRPFEMVSLSR